MTTASDPNGAKAETYDMMHDIAVRDLGYPSILEALEATPPAGGDAIPAGEQDIYEAVATRTKVAQLLHDYEHAKAMNVSGGREKSAKARQDFIASVCALIAP